jgi:D-serine deaminase-like pyridoxal phosphate-dependent protein
MLPADLDTPTVVVDADRMETNLARMAALAEASGVELLPHAKTHKCVPIARRQLAHGARGLTVATLDEAELFADCGCERLFIAHPLWAGGGRAARLRKLHERLDLRVGVDSRPGAERLAAAVGGTDRPLEVLIEIDCGGRRSGVRPDQVAELATQVLRLGLDVRGAFSHPGHAYATPGAAPDAAADERAALAAAAAGLAPLIGAPPVLSGGSTPTALDGLAAPLTEVRPGTYVFGDRQQMTLSGIGVEEVALVVAARVVSAPRHGEVVLDAGSKALSSDRPAWLKGHGRVLEAPDAVIESLSEEHAIVRGLGAGSGLAVGDLVGVIPNHVCTAVNLAREITVVSGGEVVDRWPVGAR